MPQFPFTPKDLISAAFGEATIQIWNADDTINCFDFSHYTEEYETEGMTYVVTAAKTDVDATDPKWQFKTVVGLTGYSGSFKIRNIQDLGTGFVDIYLEKQ